MKNGRLLYTSVNDVQINDLASFGSIVKSAQINHGKLKIKVKNTGFLPFPEQGTTNWRKLDNYSFTSREIPIRSNVSTFNIAYCNPGVFIMKASNKRDQNSTTARIGDKVTEINQIRTQNMTRDEFDVQVWCPKITKNKYNIKRSLLWVRATHATLFQAVK